MVLIRRLLLAGVVVLASSCLEQYNPYPFWNKLAQERQAAHQEQVKLTLEGKVPAALLAGGDGAPVEEAFDAAKVYESNCVACHGADGGGIPAMNSRNFKDPEWQSLATDAQIAAVILYGSMAAAEHEPSLKERSKFKLQNPTMIAWKHLFAADEATRQEQLGAMVQHIRKFK